MKLTKDDLKQKVSSLEIAPELQIELLEDIEDSMDVAVEEDASVKEEAEAAFNELQTKYNELLERYKERFLTKVEEEEAEEAPAEEPEEKEVVDVKELKFD